MSKKVTFKIPVASMLGILFIALKLSGSIDWEWWVVLSPFWIPIVIIVGIFFLLILFAVISAILGAIFS